MNARYIYSLISSAIQGALFAIGPKLNRSGYDRLVLTNIFRFAKSKNKYSLSWKKGNDKRNKKQSLIEKQKIDSFKIS